MKIQTLFVLCLSALGIVFLLAPFLIPTSLRLLYNPSESAAIGWYKIEYLNEPQRGDLVVAYLSPEAEQLASARGYLPRGIPVIKTVWATSGDKICIEDEMLLVSGQPLVRLLKSDRHGRSMPAWLDGCLTLPDNQVLLISDLTDDSFDSRYFGPLPEANIIGRAVWIGPEISLPSWQMGGARGLGAECKIKGPGTNWPLDPCLHITFYSSIGKNIVPLAAQIPNSDHRIGWFHWLYMQKASSAYTQ